MKTKQPKHLKEHGAAYATEPRRKPRSRNHLPFPQARYLTRKERIALEAYKNYLLEKLPDEIERLVLFGSKARGEGSRDSDVDLLIVVAGQAPSPRPEDSRRSVIVKGTEEVDSKYHVYVSPIVRHVNQVRKWTPLLDHVNKEGVELWRRPETNFASWPEGGDVAMVLDKREHIKARMAMAHDKLSTARDLMEKNHYNDAISRAYYAMFYASKAVLLALGEDPHKHEGVVSAFGERVAKVGLSDPKFGTLLSNAKGLREEADYEDFFHATKEQTENAIRNAEDFVGEAENVLKRILSK